MASRLSIRQNFFRDLPPAIVLLGCAFVIVSLAIFLFPYWSPSPRDGATRPHSKELEPQLNEFNFDNRYAGKIVTGLPYENKCRELILDNRNGKIWDKGYINCDEILRKDHRENMDLLRLREVGKAFRHEGD